MADWTNPRTWSHEKLLSTVLNVHVRDNLGYLKDNVGLGAPSELTIADGVITKAKAYHTIDTEANAASDDLLTINGGVDGDIIFLQAENDAHTVVIKDLDGNIHCGGDIYLDDAHKVVGLMYNGTLSEWHPIGAYSVERTMIRNTFAFPSTTDWLPAATGATLAQNKTTTKCWLPLSIFKIGDIIVGYTLVGDVHKEDACTLDCKLVRVNLADPITETAVPGGNIAQIDSNGNFEAAKTLTTPETIATTKQYVLEILGTTGIGDTFIVMGAEILVIRLL